MLAKRGDAKDERHYAAAQQHYFSGSAARTARPAALGEDAMAGVLSARTAPGASCKEINATAHCVWTPASRDSDFRRSKVATARSRTLDDVTSDNKVFNSATDCCIWTAL